MALSPRSALFAIAFTILGATLGATASAVAGGHAKRGKAGPMKFAQAMAGLDLSEEQQQMLSDLRDEVRTEVKAQHEGKGDEMKLFAQAIANGEDIDRAAMHSRIDAAAAEKVAMAHKVVDGLVDVYETLDESQRSELSRMFRERMEQNERRAKQLAPEGRPNRP
jgi:Spy/CpxP family protein refolding chaperone